MAEIAVGRADDDVVEIAAAAEVGSARLQKGADVLAAPVKAEQSRLAEIRGGVLALAIVVLLQSGDPTEAATIAAAVAVLALVGQVVAVRPALTRRSDAVLAGEGGARSHAHLAYIALEAVKVVALVVAGVLLLRG